jgi:cell division transport system permease protein
MGCNIFSPAIVRERQKYRFSTVNVPERASPPAIQKTKTLFLFTSKISNRMAQSSKAAARRGKPSYIMSIIGVTLVLFLLGIVGWLVINGNKLGDAFRENVQIRAYLKETYSSKDSLAVANYLKEKTYIRSVEFVGKEKAKTLFIQEENENIDKVLEYNPLPDAYFFHVKKEYANIDSLEVIKGELSQNDFFSLIEYPKGTVSNLNRNLNRISLVLLIFASIMAISVIFLIDNTIRLAMFSNRFLIKTMQMVGATRGFIAKPLSLRAILNGAISALIAIFLVYLLIKTLQTYWPDVSALQDTKMMLILFLALMLIGIGITFFSTWRSVQKYLKMKLDDLY